jgi:hypothetical protein
MVCPKMQDVLQNDSNGNFNGEEAASLRRNDVGLILFLEGYLRGTFGGP